MQTKTRPFRGNDHPLEAASIIARRLQTLANLAGGLIAEIEALQSTVALSKQAQPAPHSQPLEATQDTSSSNVAIDFYGEVERYEIELIRMALLHCGGIQKQAARLLGLKATTLHAKIKHYGLKTVASLSDGASDSGLGSAASNRLFLIEREAPSVR